MTVSREELLEDVYQAALLVLKDWESNLTGAISILRATVEWVDEYDSQRLPVGGRKDGAR